MSKHKAIFLDIDGVMINEWSEGQPKSKWFNEDMRPFDPKSVDALNKIINKSGAKIIVSSGWRHDLGPQLLAESFAFNRVKAHPYPLPYDYRGSFTNHEQPRYAQRCAEIEEYLYTRQPGGFVIIDDAKLPCFSEKQVNPEANEGLQDKHISEILELLKHSPIFPE